MDRRPRNNLGWPCGKRSRRKAPAAEPSHSERPEPRVNENAFVPVSSLIALGTRDQYLNGRGDDERTISWRGSKAQSHALLSANGWRSRSPCEERQQTGYEH